MVGWGFPGGFRFWVGKKSNGKSKGEIRGSLHCANHNETVSSFGRDDVLFIRVEEEESPQVPTG